MSRVPASGSPEGPLGARLSPGTGISCCLCRDAMSLSGLLRVIADDPQLRRALELADGETSHPALSATAGADLVGPPALRPLLAAALTGQGGSSPRGTGQSGTGPGLTGEGGTRQGGTGPGGTGQGGTGQGGTGQGGTGQGGTGQGGTGALGTAPGGGAGPPPACGRRRAVSGSRLRRSGRRRRNSPPSTCGCARCSASSPTASRWRAW